MTDPTLPIPFCYTCPYWDSTNYVMSDRDAETHRKGETEGEFIERLTLESQNVLAQCRRRAPRHADVVKATRGRSDVADWPYTSNYDWCGDHPDFAAYVAKWRAKRDAAGRGYGTPNYYGDHDDETEDES